MRVLVCGGRDFADRELLARTLDSLFNKLTFLIHGGASGADTLADEWAETNGIPRRAYRANWNNLHAPGAIVKTTRAGKPYNARAGIWRNQRMLVEGKPDLVIAFAGGSGTANMVSLAKKAGVPVEIVS